PPDVLEARSRKQNLPQGIEEIQSQSHNHHRHILYGSHTNDCLPILCGCQKGAKEFGDGADLRLKGEKAGKERSGRIRRKIREKREMEEEEEKGCAGEKGWMLMRGEIVGTLGGLRISGDFRLEGRERRGREKMKEKRRTEKEEDSLFRSRRERKKPF
ncbi:hypothetical protein Tco_0726697, partial [Tanacetum coccineum]